MKVIIITILITLAITILMTFLAIPQPGDVRAPKPERMEDISLLVWLHLATVLPAVPLGAYVLLTKKGTKRHKLAGRIWATLMLTTATIALFINDVNGGFGPIHIFSIVAFVTIPYAVWNIRRGNVDAHKYSMIGAMIGLIVAGAFAFLPGRTIWSVFIG